MTDKLLNWTPIFLLIFLTLLTWWLDRKVHDMDQIGHEKNQSTPDFYIDGYLGTSMYANGEKKYELSGTHFFHFINQETANLQSPKLVYFNYDKNPIVFRANTANILDKGDTILLQGNVSIIRDRSKLNELLSISTQRMQILPNQEIATTESLVQIVKGNSKIRSIGLEYDNKTGRMNLLSEAKIEYANSNPQLDK